MKKSIKLLRNIAIICIAVLIGIVIIIQVAYHLKLNDDFYSSGIPNDPVPMGMRSYDVKSVLGEPEDEIALVDSYQVGFAGNNYEFRETGEVLLFYSVQVFGESYSIKYSYYKPDRRINHVLAYVGEYKTLDEATAMVEKLLDHAKQKFDQKGDYQIELLDSVVSSLTYRLSAENNTDRFVYEISISDSRKLGLERDAPYSVNVYQNLFSKKPEL